MVSVWEKVFYGHLRQYETEYVIPERVSQVDVEIDKDINKDNNKEGMSII